MDQQMRSWIAARQRLVGRVHIPQPLSAVVVGFLTGEFGVAESARLTARALQDAQITTKILPLVAPMHGNHDMTLAGYGRATEPLGFNIFHVNADSMAATMRTPSVVRMVQVGWRCDRGMLHKIALGWAAAGLVRAACFSTRFSLLCMHPWQFACFAAQCMCALLCWFLLQFVKNTQLCMSLC